MVDGTWEVADLTWDAVARRLAGGAPAILPIGAGAKQHGWHLPMRTDAIQAEFLAARLAERFDGLIWPTISYGYYPAFVDYAGSCSLSPETFQATVREIVTALAGYGARQVLVVNTGISTIAPVDRALAAVPGCVLHLKVYDGPRYREAAARLATQPHGGHADELETSCLLALAPELTRMDRAVASAVEPPWPGPMQRQDPTAANYSESGSIGDPTRATVEKGQELLAAMVADVIAVVEGCSPVGSTVRSISN